MNEDFYNEEMAREYWYEETYLWLNVDCCGMVEIPDNFIFFPEGKQ